MKTPWHQILLVCAALWGGAPALLAQTLTAGSVGNVDANGRVAFSLTFDRAPDFLTTDSVGRQAVEFQFYIGAGPVPPTNTSRPFLSLVQGGSIHASGDLVIRNEGPPDPSPGSGGWGTVRGRVSYALNGRTLTFSVPASVLNVSGPFVYSVDLASYGSTTSSYTGASGGPLQFTAPLSLARSVYRDTATVIRSVLQNGRLPVPVSIATQSTIIFEDETRFTYLVYREGGTPPEIDSSLRVLPPQPNGSYQLTRPSNNRALLTLNFDGGTSATWALDFTSPAAGVGADPFTQRSFSLSDLGGSNLATARNVSMRATAGAGRPLVVGFIVPGPREVLIRAVGPSLQPFGVTSTWADPDFQIYQGSSVYQTAQRFNADWDAPLSGENATRSGPGLKKIFSYLGAFPLQDGAKDAAGLVRLGAGAYTIVCAPAPGDAGGEVLVEVYFLP